jgi:glycosyltransferase involved in cell wall biosynthesis
MKILVISNLYPPFVIGGYEINCANVVAGLQARGHEVLVATAASHLPAPLDAPSVRRCLRAPAFGPQYAAPDAPPWLAHGSGTSSFDNVLALSGLLREFQPDIVFLWNLHGLGGLHLIDFLNVNQVPWAIYLGDLVFELMVHAAPPHVNAVFRGNDPAHVAAGGIIAVSQHLVDEMDRHWTYRFAEPPTIVHGYAIAPGPASSRAYLADGRTRFITAGRVSAHKGMTIICDAVARLVDEGRTDFSVDVFGDGDIAAYVAHAQSLGIAHCLMFHGAVRQSVLQAHYRTHDAFLFPTWRREPFAFAPFEAAAQGCVPILTADCGCAERIVHQVHGIKIDRTAPALAEAMRAVIDGRTDLARIGRAAQAMVRADLSLDGHVDKIEAVLERQRRSWAPAGLNDPRALLLAFVKHHLSVAFRFGPPSPDTATLTQGDLIHGPHAA